MVEYERLNTELEKIVEEYFPELSGNKEDLPQGLRKWHSEEGESEYLKDDVIIDLQYLCHGSEEDYITFGAYTNDMKAIRDAAKKLDVLLKNMPKQHRGILEQQMLLACPRWKRKNDEDQGVYYDAKRGVVIIPDDYTGLTGWHKKLDEYKNQTPAPTELILSASSIVLEISDHILKHEIFPDGVKAKNGANKKNNYIYAFYLFWKLIKGEEPNTATKKICFISFVCDVFKVMNFVDLTSSNNIETMKTVIKNITKKEKYQPSSYCLYDEILRINNPASLQRKVSLQK